MKEAEIAGKTPEDKPAGWLPCPFLIALYVVKLLLS